MIDPNQMRYDYQNAALAWTAADPASRGNMPQFDDRAYRDALRGLPAQQPQTPLQQQPQQAPAPWMPPAMPQGPQNMLGSSYGVSGMMNALSGFGLPRY